MSPLVIAVIAAGALFFLRSTPPIIAQTQPATVQYLAAAQVDAAFAKGGTMIPADGHNYSVVAGRRDKSGEAELHKSDADIMHVLQGTAVFVTGGTIANAKEISPGEVRGASIHGGETRTISQGDVLIVPANTPHWFKQVDGVFLYFVVKARE